MKVEGKLFRANWVLQTATVEEPESDLRFSARLERCLIALCHQLEIPVPLWMNKNTREFARFHQTVFPAEQFTEPVHFDRFQIRWIE
ncbi:MAG: hypothetical protein KBG64_06555 [Clostridia bacterium]|nr:hypothetical protein [Clostridia bacterium]